MHHRWPKTNGLSPTYLPPIVQAFVRRATACPDNSGLSIWGTWEWIIERHESDAGWINSNTGKDWDEGNAQKQGKAKSIRIKDFRLKSKTMEELITNRVLWTKENKQDKIGLICLHHIWYYFIFTSQQKVYLSPPLSCEDLLFFITCYRGVSFSWLEIYLFSLRGLWWCWRGRWGEQGVLCINRAEEAEGVREWDSHESQSWAGECSCEAVTGDLQWWVII